MPNRIIKESICTSDSVDQLSWFEEVLFYRLIVSCDDYGRFDGRPAIIKGRLFPLKSVTDKQIESAIIKLSTAGIAKLYRVDGRPYLQLCACLLYTSDAMRFEPGDQVEIFVDDDAVVYRKYKAAEIALDLLADLEESVSDMDDFERNRIGRHIRKIEMILKQDKAPDAAATAIEQ